MPRKFVLVLILAAMTTPVSRLYAGQGEEGSAQVFTGEIMDAFCAKEGTHGQMMQQMKSMGTDAKTCTVKCHQMGAQYVLFDATKHTIYTLDNPDKAESFAGQKVRISGTLHKNKIQVANISPAS